MNTHNPLIFWRLKKRILVVERNIHLIEWRNNGGILTHTCEYQKLSHSPRINNKYCYCLSIFLICVWTDFIKMIYDALKVSPRWKILVLFFFFFCSVCEQRKTCSSGGFVWWFPSYCPFHNKWMRWYIISARLHSPALHSIACNTAYKIIYSTSHFTYLRSTNTTTTHILIQYMYIHLSDNFCNTIYMFILWVAPIIFFIRDFSLDSSMLGTIWVFATSSNNENFSGSGFVIFAFFFS